MASKNNNPKGREIDIVVQELKGELLIYDLKINKAYCLNPTSAAIWKLCDGQSSVSDITEQLSKKLKQPVTDDLIWLALDQFKTDKLLSDNETVEIKFDGLSRREAIKKVGFASMIALPVISSLVAPTGAMAQSGGVAAGSRTLGQSCSTSTDCASAAPNCNESRCCTGSGSFPSGTTATFCSDSAANCQQLCQNIGSSLCCSGSANARSNGNTFPQFSCICT
jgi:hypothetical protein